MLSNIEIFQFFLNETAPTHHQRMVEKGFWEGEADWDDRFMLTIGEAGEAQEAHRKRRFAKLERLEFELSPKNEWPYERHFSAKFEAHVKDSFEDELADVLLRLMDIAGKDQCFFVLPGNLQVSERAGAALLHCTKMIAAAHTARTAWMMTAKPEEAIQFDTYCSMLSAVAEIVYRIAEVHDIDIIAHVRAKMQYNLTRERLHGKAY